VQLERWLPASMLEASAPLIKKTRELSLVGHVLSQKRAVSGGNGEVKQLCSN